jgi:hypothetical protein
VTLKQKVNVKLDHKLQKIIMTRVLNGETGGREQNQWGRVKREDEERTNMVKVLCECMKKE